MAKTMRDLFTSSDKNIQHKNDKENTRINQSLKGIRTKNWLPNIPLLYGSDTIRITNKTTDDVELMKGNTTGATGGTGGLVGKGLSVLSGGRVNSLQGAESKIKSKLGLPSVLIPTRVSDQLRGRGDTSTRMDELASIRSAGGGTPLGNFLNSTGGGTPKQIINHSVGQGVQMAKKAIRGVIFGTNTQMDTPGVENTINSDRMIPITTDKLPYTKMKPFMLQTLVDGNEMTPFGDQLIIPPYISIQRRQPKDTLNEQSIDYYSGLEYKAVGKDAQVRNLFEKENKYATEAVVVKIEVDGQDPIRFHLPTIHSLSESFSPSWSSSKMIGSPFSQHTYEGIDRTISFNMKLYSTSPDDHEKKWKLLDELAKLVYPLKYSGTVGFITPPIVKLTIGSLYKEKYGFINSLSYDMDDTVGWDTGFEDPFHSSFKQGENAEKAKVTAGDTRVLPKLINVSISYTFIEGRQDVENATLYSFESVT